MLLFLIVVYWFASIHENFSELSVCIVIGWNWLNPQTWVLTQFSGSNLLLFQGGAGFSMVVTLSEPHVSGKKNVQNKTQTSIFYGQMWSLITCLWCNASMLPSCSPKSACTLPLLFLFRSGYTTTPEHRTYPLPLPWLRLLSSPFPNRTRGHQRPTRKGQSMDCPSDRPVLFNHNQFIHVNTQMHAQQGNGNIFTFLKNEKPLQLVKFQQIKQH